MAVFQKHENFARLYYRLPLRPIRRFFESPTVFAYILTMLGVGLLLDFVMLRLQAASAWSTAP
jgi:hypothetical protein